MADAFDELANAVQGIRDALRTIEHANRLPSVWEFAGQKVVVNGNSYHDDDKRALTVAAEIKKATVATLRERGEAERDRILAETAGKLESLRAILPTLAARAAVALGETARSIQQTEIRP